MVASSSNCRHGTPDVLRIDTSGSSVCGSVELCVKTLVILRAKFHVVSILLSVLKIAILTLA